MSFSDQLFLFFRDHKGMPFRTMTFFNALLEATVCGALLILLVLLLRRFLRAKLGSRLIYFAWLLVAARLLLPVSLPNPAMNELRPTLSTDAAARPIADQIRVRAQDALYDLSRPYVSPYHTAELSSAFQTNQAGAEEGAYGLAELLHDLGVYTSYGWTGKWVFFGYLAVCGGVLCYVAARNVAFRRGLKRGRVCVLSMRDEQTYLAMCRRRGLKPLPVWFVDPLPCACLVGVLRPYIALPLTVRADELPAVLAHELCHYQARDHWWALLRAVCCVVHWFNPLVWVAARLSRFDCEMACDERVTAAMNDDERIAYANTLVVSAMRRNAPRVTALATGMTMNAKRLKKRISSVLRSPAVRRGTLIAFAVVACVVTLLAFATDENRTMASLAQRDLQSRYAQSGGLPPAGERFNAMTLDISPITSGPEAAQQAIRYLQAGMLQNAPFRARALNGSTYHAPEGWYVFAAMEENRAFEMLLGDDGTLLTYNSRILEDEPTPANGLSAIPQENLMSYFEQFAQTCYGEAASNLDIRADAYDEDGRYLSGAVTIGGRTRGFMVRVAPYVELLSFYTDVSAVRTVFHTQENVFYSMWAYQRDELGIARLDMRHTRMKVIWEEQNGCWLGEMKLQASLLPASAADRLAADFGAMDTYALQLRYDLQGEQVGEIALGEGSGRAADAFVPIQTYNPPSEGGMPQAPLSQTGEVTLQTAEGSAAFTLREKGEDNSGFVPAPADAMPVTSALQIALEAIQSKYGVKPAELTKYLVEYGYAVEDAYFATPHWQLDFMDASTGCVFEIMVHAPDGAVVYLSGYNEGNG